MVRIAINGFGRIGRGFTRAIHNRPELELVAVNDLAPAENLAYLLKYDTVYGRAAFSVAVEAGAFVIDGKKVALTQEKDPAKLPWKDLGIDIVMECTGIFTAKDKASLHLTAGAKHVVISAPVRGDGIPTVVLGVNEAVLKEHANAITILSNASCTTNSVAPVAAIMHAKIGVKKAMLMTVHGYTDDQNLQDNSHRDLRRARAAAANIVPTSTGAAIAATEAVPELKGLFDGLALRVPVITGSISDFTFVTARSTSVEEVNEMFIDAARTPPYQGILAVTNEPLVSSDIIGRPESSIVDLGLTRVIDGDLVKVMAWYDNEIGYSHRLVEQIIKVSELI